VDHPLLGAVTMVGPVVEMSGTPTTARRASPTIGQHNADILIEIGYSEADVAQLVQTGVLSGS
jgi:crotonobetainyl-CoA:carnitine CoA-transferase CaiB-like acyl-CoA transferase